MHGVPKDLDLRRLHGATLTQICLGEFEQQFHFSKPDIHLSVEGAWQVQNSDGETVDRSLPNEQRDAYRVHRLLGRSVTGHELDPPSSFTLRFDNGWALVVFDSSKEYESFSMQPGDVFV
jgi:hypothetical protein